MTKNICTQMREGIKQLLFLFLILSITSYLYLEYCNVGCLNEYTLLALIFLWP